MLYLFLGLIFVPILTGTFLFAFGHYKYNGFVFVSQTILTLLWISLSAFWTSNGFLAQKMTLGGWSPLVSIELSYDTHSALFTGMTILAFWACWLFIWPERKTDQKFVLFVSLLQGTLIAIYLSNDLFSWFVLIELMAILCAILITYKRDSHSVRAGLYYLLFQSWGMLFYLFGVLWLYRACGTLNISYFLDNSKTLMTIPHVRLALVFILTGIGVKSAFFPLFVWLPPAHSAAPAAISALLSGIVVKTGIFMLLRLNMMSQMTQISELLIIIGLISGLFGAIFAMLQSDMKRILAYHTVSQVGLITFGLGLGGSKGEWGAMLHIFNHFTFKSLLFLSVGLLVLKTGERRLKCYQGLWQWNKPLSLCLLIGILGITGFPLMNGSLSKMLIKYGAEGQWVTLTLQAVNLGTLISFTKLFLILFGKPSEVLQKSAPPKGASLFAPFFMAVLTLVALPLELYLLSLFAPQLSTAFYYKWSTDVFSYGFFAIIAYVVYKIILTPILKKHPHFAHEDVSFNNGIITSIVFLAGMGLYIM